MHLFTVYPLKPTNSCYCLTAATVTKATANNNRDTVNREEEVRIHIRQTPLIHLLARKAVIMVGDKAAPTVSKFQSPAQLSRRY